MSNRTISGAALAGCLVAAFAPAAPGALILPGGDNFLNGSFEFEWGIYGAARIDPALYVGGNAAFPTGLDEMFLPPEGVAAATGLVFDYHYSGDGTGALQIVYQIANTTGTTWHDLRFIGDVSGDPFDSFAEVVGVMGPGGGTGDPHRYGIDDYYLGDLFTSDILNDGNLDNADLCGAAPCDAEAALQWNLATLADGQIWEIAITLSDLGMQTSQRWIEFDLVGDTLTFSGTATVVPLPASLFLLGGALAMLGWARRSL